ncbi:hypothetical protein A2Z00_00600 [Candidatus Gottesmanbacteria bacterium RBG_13_45_10]|uniref:Uncharacterized protein n=1 Tax=Candidatus Gottesmanbacteria bacterium RBG_13_45_10 TaxID=1798370 RepID=A0A1F5ZGW6_9BACT|nr:MAG: hypothetical protein A2Z00_00600 [Candidatus Gottesmanbacteria bacterium RBG_13_45_10]
MSNNELSTNIAGKIFTTWKSIPSSFVQISGFSLFFLIFVAIFHIEPLVWIVFAVVIFIALIGVFRHPEIFHTGKVATDILKQTMGSLNKPLENVQDAVYAEVGKLRRSQLRKSLKGAKK